MARWRSGLARMSLQVVDAGLEFAVLVHDLLALEGGQAAQLEGQDRVGLDGVHVEQLDEAVRGPRRPWGSGG